MESRSLLGMPGKKASFRVRENLHKSNICCQLRKVIVIQSAKSLKLKKATISIVSLNKEANLKKDLDQDQDKKIEISK